MVGGSLNNKIFPNKKTLKKLFLDAFYPWCKQNAIPCPPERWLTQQFAKPDFQTTLLQPPFDNFRINFLTVFSTMRTNEPSPFEFFAHANIFPASTRLSVIPLFLARETVHSDAQPNHLLLPTPYLSVTRTYPILSFLCATSSRVYTQWHMALSPYLPCGLSLQVYTQYPRPEAFTMTSSFSCMRSPL